MENGFEGVSLDELVRMYVKTNRQIRILVADIQNLMDSRIERLKDRDTMGESMESCSMRMEEVEGLRSGIGELCEEVMGL